MKKTTLLLVSSLSALVAATAAAQTAPLPAATGTATPEAVPTLSVNIGVASSYIFRGLNQSDYKPALQIGADYAHPSGFYVGIWGSSIRWLKDFGVSNSNAEIDVYAGYKAAIGGVGYDIGVLQYYYPGSLMTGATRGDTTEIYVAGTYQMFTAKYSHTVSNSTFAAPNSRNSGYFDLGATFPLTEALALNAHVGHQIIKNSGGAGTYSDAKVELAYDFGGGLSLSGGVTATDANKDFYTPTGHQFTGKTIPYALLKYTKSF